MSNLGTCLGSSFRGVELRRVSHESMRLLYAVSGYAHLFLGWAVSGVVNLAQCSVASPIGLDRHVIWVGYDISLGRSFFPVGDLIEFSTFADRVIVIV